MVSKVKVSKVKASGKLPRTSRGGVKRSTKAPVKGKASIKRKLPLLRPLTAKEHKRLGLSPKTRSFVRADVVRVDGRVKVYSRRQGEKRRAVERGVATLGQRRGARAKRMYESIRKEMRVAGVSGEGIERFIDYIKQAPTLVKEEELSSEEIIQGAADILVEVWPEGAGRGSWGLISRLMDSFYGGMATWEQEELDIEYDTRARDLEDDLRDLEEGLRGSEAELRASEEALRLEREESRERQLLFEEAQLGMRTAEGESNRLRMELSEAHLALAEQGKAIGRLTEAVIEQGKAHAKEMAELRAQLSMLMEQVKKG